ncbi:unnamed protein product [Sphenostylis stenocarpa]|uniref:Uncharacterized protein n=1 Tax=Sphenostylis stenocarpa TaxID=92480 RepID=A0AA86W315_9FABA|nr:unnamed protein product [Sphenostylis stenocarpa]
MMVQVRLQRKPGTKTTTAFSDRVDYLHSCLSSKGTGQRHAVHSQPVSQERILAVLFLPSKE